MSKQSTMKQNHQTGWCSINNNDICSFPNTSSYAYTLISPSYVSYFASSSGTENKSVNLISCQNPLNNSSLFTDITQDCDSHHTFRYVYVGRIMASQVPHMCRLDLIVMTSWPGFVDLKKVSLSQIHHSLLYGFELRFCYNCSEKSTIRGKNCI